MKALFTAALLLSLSCSQPNVIYEREPAEHIWGSLWTTEPVDDEKTDDIITYVCTIVVAGVVSGWHSLPYGFSPESQHGPCYEQHIGPVELVWLVSEDEPSTLIYADFIPAR